MRRIFCHLAWPLVVVLVGCTGAKEQQQPAGQEPADLPPCARAAGPAVSLPPEFPASFPLPPGTVITKSSAAGAAGVRVEGLVPLGLRDAANFFAKGLPAAGYKLGRGETEAGDAESRFEGNGYAGYLQMRVIADCPGAVTLTLTLSKYK